MSLRDLAHYIWRSEVAWGFANTAVLAGYGLSVLPFQASHLSVGAVGVWYTFLAISSLVTMICNGGITPTVQRFASYLYAGAEELSARGVPIGNAGRSNRVALVRFGRSVQVLFIWLSIGGGVVTSLVGFTFIDFRVVEPDLRHQAFIGWAIQVAGTMVLILAAGKTALVQGAGGLLESQRVLFIARIAAPLAVVLALWFGLGVISLGVGTLTMGLLQWMLHRRHFPQVSFFPGASFFSTATINDIRVMWPTTWRFIIVTLGAWMIVCSGPLILGWVVGLREAGQYGLTLQLLQFCVALATVWMSTALPALCAARSSGDRLMTRKIFIQRLALGLITYLISALGVIIFAPLVLGYLAGGSVMTLSISAFAVLAIVTMLELNHGSLCANFLMTANEVPFFGAAIISGVFILCLSIYLATFTSLGVWSIIIAQGLIQALYNNWYWPLTALRKSRI